MTQGEADKDGKPLPASYFRLLNESQKYGLYAENFRAARPSLRQFDEVPQPKMEWTTAQMQVAVDDLRAFVQEGRTLPREADRGDNSPQSAALILAYMEWARDMFVYQLPVMEAVALSPLMENFDQWWERQDLPVDMFKPCRSAWQDAKKTSDRTG